MLRLLSLFTVIFCLFVSSAQATEINKAGETRLKTLFSHLIEQRKLAANEIGSILKTEGDILVEQASDYYAVTLPSMTLTNKDGMKSEIGLIAINATPTEKPDDWKMSIALPTPILYSDNKDNQLMRLDIGNQEMGGIWNGDLQKFSKLSARYSDIKLTHLQRQEFLTLNKLEVVSDLKEEKPDHWSGPAKMAITGLNIEKADKTKVLNLEEASIAIDVKNLPVIKNIEEEKADITPPNILDKIINRIGEKAFMKASIKNLDVDAPSFLDLPFQGLTLEMAETSLSVSGLKTDNIEQAFKFQYNGLVQTDIKEGEESLFPNKASILFNIHQLPLKKISGTLANLIPNKDNESAAKQVAVMQAMLTLPQILSTAGTLITLDSNASAKDKYSGKLNGTVKANKNSIIGATGEAVFSMSGLNKVIALIEKSKKRKNTLKRLKALKKICAKDEEEQEKTVTCHFKLNEQAKLTVNDQDMQALLDTINGDPIIEDMSEGRSDAASPPE